MLAKFLSVENYTQNQIKKVSFLAVRQLELTAFPISFYRCFY